MIWQQAFLKRILDDAPTAALVDDRAEYGRSAETVPLPRIDLNVTSDPRPDHFKGAQGLRMSRVQVDVFSATLSEALEIAELAIAAIRDPAVVDDVTFERSGIEGPETSGTQEAALYVNRARFDALVWHKQI